MGQEKGNVNVKYKIASHKRMGRGSESFVIIYFSSAYHSVSAVSHLTQISTISQKRLSMASHSAPVFHQRFIISQLSLQGSRQEAVGGGTTTRREGRTFAPVVRLI